MRGVLIAAMIMATACIAENLDERPIEPPTRQERCAECERLKKRVAQLERELAAARQRAELSRKYLVRSLAILDQ